MLIGTYVTAQPDQVLIGKKSKSLTNEEKLQKRYHNILLELMIFEKQKNFARQTWSTCQQHGLRAMSWN